MMPRKSGIEALRELRAEGVETPALIVSAHQDAGDAELDVSGYVTKPIDFERLFAAIAELDRLLLAACSGGQRCADAQDLAISSRISLPFSLVPSRNSTARSA